jgi:hypothetical protein
MLPVSSFTAPPTIRSVAIEHHVNTSGENIDRTIETAFGPFRLGPYDAPAGMCKSHADRLGSRLAISQHLYRVYGQMLDGLLIDKAVDLDELRLLKRVEARLSCGDFDALPFAPSLDLVKRFYAFTN